MDHVSEALALRIVTRAARERPFGFSPPQGRGPGAGDLNGRPTHVACPPVYTGVLTPSVHSAKRGQPDALSGQVPCRRPRRRPTVREGNGEAGKGRGRKRRPSVHGTDRGNL
jgi:hypothetical protein